MSKALEALEDIILYLNASEPKGLYCENIETIQQALQRLEAIEKGKNTDIIDNYMAFKNDNADPSEALECLEALEQDIKDRIILAENRQLKLCSVIKQALMKTQEPKQYLKWEDLDFNEELKVLNVRMNNNDYILRYTLNNFGGKCCFLYDSARNHHIDLTRQFFNDLHLEVLE